MANDFAKSQFPSLYAKVERQRQNSKNRSLTMPEINALLSMRFNNEPVFDSIELFYTEEYKNALESNVPVAELEKIGKFRPATEREVNLLYSDIHAREDKIEMSGSSPD
ncbi:MAG: hypothetical protein GX639_22370 [Fibrobacter sp.]|nr:hypothetical protein [Fibrobacter sp.]